VLLNARPCSHAADYVLAARHIVAVVKGRAGGAGGAGAAGMSNTAYKTVVLGGGNSAGYAAWEWVKRDGGEGLAIIGDEPVRRQL